MDHHLLLKLTLSLFSPLVWLSAHAGTTQFCCLYSFSLMLIVWNIVWLVAEPNQQLNLLTLLYCVCSLLHNFCAYIIFHTSLQFPISFRFVNLLSLSINNPPLCFQDSQLLWQTVIQIELVSIFQALLGMFQLYLPNHKLSWIKAVSQ